MLLIVWHSRSYINANEYVSFFFGFNKRGCYYIMISGSPGSPPSAYGLSFETGIYGAGGLISITACSNYSVLVISSLNSLLLAENLILN